MNETSADQRTFEETVVYLDEQIIKYTGLWAEASKPLPKKDRKYWWGFGWLGILG